MRVIAYNVFGGQGWPKDRWRTKAAQAKDQMPARLALELGLYDPDIITFSESPPEDVVQEIASLLKMNYAHFPGGGNWPGALMTRYEIGKAENVPLEGARPRDLFTRHWGRAEVKVPGVDPLIVHTAHLYPTGDASVRLREISAILKSMAPDRQAGRAILLMGDLNHGPETREYRAWMESGLVDTFARVGQGEGRTIRSDIRRWRIDYVMAAGPIADHIVESRPLFEGNFRLHIADKESFALSDHVPQSAVFSWPPAN